LTFALPRHAHARAHARGKQTMQPRGTTEGFFFAHRGVVVCLFIPVASPSLFPSPRTPRSGTTCILRTSTVV
jgi:hypothetical protein